MSPHIDSPVTTGTAPPVEPRAALRDGVVTMAPFAAGYVPFALVIGAAVARHGSRLAGWTGSWLIYGGSAHLTALRTLDASGAPAAVLTALTVNARLLVYAASMRDAWRDQPRWFKLAAAPLIIDPTWSLAQRRRDLDAQPAAQRAFFAAAGVTLGAVWSTAIGVGAVAGNAFDLTRIEVAVPLCLTAVVVPRLKAHGGPMAVAFVVALAGSRLPLGTGTLLAVAVATAAGALWEGRS